ncbi:hypothetical protein [Peribacillus frigoritolerans]|uniref:Uncharacterized protein n=1 Tax=Peribacillus castrilensis TaxID=2897690 RepID=A0AAW9NPD4_9BACI|nr:hypothetical protein [Peribacillus castrilensis]
MVTNGNKSYLLSFTAFFNAEKEYTLSVNLHQAIEVHTDYKFETPVYNTYDGDILWDGKDGKKVVYRGSIFYPKLADIPIADADSPSVFTSSSLMTYLSLVHGSLQSRIVDAEGQEIIDRQAEMIFKIKEVAGLIAAETLSEGSTFTKGELSGAKKNTVELEADLLNFEDATTAFIYGMSEEIIQTTNFLYADTEHTISATDIHPVQYGEHENLILTRYLSDVLYGYELGIDTNNRRIEPVYEGDHQDYLDVPKVVVDIEMQNLLHANINDLIADNQQLNATLRLLEIQYGEPVVELIMTEYQRIMEASIHENTEAATSFVSESAEDLITQAETRFLGNIDLQEFIFSSSNSELEVEMAGTDKGIFFLETSTSIEYLQQANSISTNDSAVLEIYSVESVQSVDVYLSDDLETGVSLNSEFALEKGLERAETGTFSTQTIIDSGPEVANSLAGTEGIYTSDFVSGSATTTNYLYLMDTEHAEMYGFQSVEHKVELAESNIPHMAIIVPGTTQAETYSGTFAVITNSIELAYPNSTFEAFIDSNFEKGEINSASFGVVYNLEEAESISTLDGSIFEIENAEKITAVLGSTEILEQAESNSSLESSIFGLENGEQSDRLVGIIETIEQADSSSRTEVFIFETEVSESSAKLLGSTETIEQAESISSIEGAIFGTETAESSADLLGSTETIEQAESISTLDGSIFEVEYAEKTATLLGSTETIEHAESSSFDGSIFEQEDAESFTNLLGSTGIEQAAQYQQEGLVENPGKAEMLSPWLGIVENPENADVHIALETELSGFDSASRRHKRKTRISLCEQAKRDKKIKARILVTELAVSLGSPPNKVVFGLQDRWLITGKPYAWNNNTWAKTR